MCARWPPAVDVLWTIGRNQGFNQFDGIIKKESFSTASRETQETACRLALMKAFQNQIADQKGFGLAKRIPSALPPQLPSNHTVSRIGTNLTLTISGGPVSNPTEDKKLEWKVQNLVGEVKVTMTLPESIPLQLSYKKETKPLDEKSVANRLMSVQVAIMAAILKSKEGEKTTPRDSLREVQNLVRQVLLDWETLSPSEEDKATLISIGKALTFVRSKGLEPTSKLQSTQPLADGLALCEKHIELLTRKQPSIPEQKDTGSKTEPEGSNRLPYGLALIAIAALAFAVGRYSRALPVRA
ncbi:MAG: hypothetical protein AB7F31_04655 [Parachlamydiales bacterium]